jgi:hypothetical protein
MATEAQVLANRGNAQKSTGPRTPEGKAIVAQNAVQHGFFTEEVVIKGEDPDQFACYREALLADLAPAGTVECAMAERIAGLAWRLRRAERLQTEAFETLYEKAAAEAAAGTMPSGGVPETVPGGPGGADGILGRMLVEDFSHARVLDRLLLHERRIENSMYRTMRELREHKRLRLAEPRSTGIRSASPSGQALPVRSMGVVMDVPAAQKTLCQTKPIGAAVGRGPGSIGMVAGLPRNESDETNPMCAGTREITVSAGEKGGNDSSRDRFEETKPISWAAPSSRPAVRRVA